METPRLYVCASNYHYRNTIVINIFPVDAVLLACAVHCALEAKKGEHVLTMESPAERQQRSFGTLHARQHRNSSCSEKRRGHRQEVH